MNIRCLHRFPSFRTIFFLLRVFLAFRIHFHPFTTILVDSVPLSAIISRSQSFPTILHHLLRFAVKSRVFWPSQQFLFYCSILSHTVPFCPTLPHPVQSCPILSHPVLSYPILPHPVLSCPILSYPVLSCPILSLSWLLFMMTFAISSCQVETECVRVSVSMLGNGWSVGDHWKLALSHSILRYVLQWQSRFPIGICKRLQYPVYYAFEFS